MLKTLLLLLLLDALVGAVSYDGECSRAADCGPQACCVVGRVRYSLPVCQPLRAEGEYCMREAEPEDKLLFYPNNVFRVVESAYDLFCPCRAGLQCRQGTCQQPPHGVYDPFEEGFEQPTNEQQAAAFRRRPQF